MVKGTISRKGQVTVPKEIREALGLKPGSRVRFELKDGYAVLLPEPQSRVDTLFGALRTDTPFPGIEEEEAAIELAWAEEADQ